MSRKKLLVKRLQAARKKSAAHGPAVIALVEQINAQLAEANRGLLFAPLDTRGAAALTKAFQDIYDREGCSARVVIDETNNPPELREQGMVVIDVYHP